MQPKPSNFNIENVILHLSFRIRLYSYHYQVVISIFIIIVSFFHLRYCCTFFFLYLPLAIGMFSLLQGIVSWRTKCHGSTTRALNIIGAAFAVLMNATTSFGIFCWFNRNTVPHMITRHCHWLSHREAYCMRVVHFTHPYIDWLPQETEREIAAIQVNLTISLTSKDPNFCQIMDVPVTCQF